MLLLTFSRKTGSFIFLIVFWIMLGNPWKIIFQNEKFLNGKIFPWIFPGSPPTPSIRKNSLVKTSVCFPITNTICKQWKKLIILKPFPKELWWIKSYSKTKLLDFSTMMNKMAIKKILIWWLRKKLAWEGA